MVGFATEDRSTGEMRVIAVLPEYETRDGQVTDLDSGGLALVMRLRRVGSAQQYSRSRVIVGLAWSVSSARHFFGQSSTQ